MTRRRRRWSNARAPLSLTIMALVAGSCELKNGKFFEPEDPDNRTPVLVDVTSPVISNLRPSGNIVLNDIGLSFDAIDPPGAVGEPVSGLNLPGMKALYGLQTLPITKIGTGNTYNIELGAIGEGQRSIGLEVPDNWGLKATAQYTFKTDFSGPTVTWTGSPNGSSTQTSSTMNVSGTYADANGVSQAFYYIRQAVNGQCSATAPLFPVGTTDGTVSQNQFTLTGGTYNLNLQLNGPPNVQRPALTTYCWHFHAEDVALDRNGTAHPNVTDRSWKLDFNWTAPPAPTEGTVTGRVTLNGSSPLSGITVAIPGRTTTTDANGNYTFANVAAGSTTVTISNVPTDVSCSPLSKSGSVVAGQSTTVNFDCIRFSVSVAATFRHISIGVSEVCAAISGVLGFVHGADPIVLANIAGASYTISWSGPGTVGTTNRSGTLDAQSSAFDRQQINAFGTYTANVTVTYSGVTKLVSANVSVVNFPGTCPAP